MPKMEEPELAPHMTKWKLLQQLSQKDVHLCYIVRDQVTSAKH
jgi:hypothetical protein